MSLSQKKIRGRSVQGFTLIELLVVVLIIGILASIAVPQYFKVVEKGKLVEATAWISNIRNSEERFYNAQGTYEPDFTKLDITFAGGTGLKFFENPAIVGTACSSGDDGFTVTLTRVDKAPNKSPKRYGPYTVVFDSCKGTFAYNCTNCSDFN